MQSGVELGMSSKSRAVFPQDIIRVSNSLQILQILLLCVYECHYLCEHTSIVWLSSQNWGQIALRCRYLGMRWFFFFFLFGSSFFFLPRFTMLDSLASLLLSLPSPLSQLTFSPPRSFFILTLCPHPPFSFHHSIFLCSFLKNSPLQHECRAGNGSVFVQNRLLPTGLDWYFSNWYQSVLPSFVGET